MKIICSLHLCAMNKGCPVSLSEIGCLEKFDNKTGQIAQHWPATG
jgi:hypothetical protein